MSILPDFWCFGSHDPKCPKPKERRAHERLRRAFLTLLFRLHLESVSETGGAQSWKGSSEPRENWASHGHVGDM